ncbi:hypothetical protein RA11412_2377 [Rothia aeria]|uniref:Uncharacterized protein n=1 Tax=Rothia aeria TaxID=172042 RepID=A0A2Z5R2H9_9MICC|nr:hypothetical protein RA11412_2377 [Rothia aeria]
MPLKTTIEQDVRKAASTVEGITRVQVEVGAMNADQRSALKSQLKPERTNPFTAPGRSPACLPWSPARAGWVSRQ